MKEYERWIIEFVITGENERIIKIYKE